ncbi:MAG: HAMP domain-containing protein [Verrucomicrobia bacterium]|nr:HAMP domain-containing protein [Verrucomicrobiota bacterium]
MLRTRLFLNLLPFVVLLLAVGGYAHVLFSRMARDLDATVMQNYRSADAVEAMKPALKKMMGELEFTMEHRQLSVALAFEANARVFEENLNVLVKNRHLFQEGNPIELLLGAYEQFRVGGASLLESSANDDLQRVFKAEVVDPHHKITILLDRVGKTSRLNLLATSGRIQDLKQRVTVLMGLGVFLALLICAFASYQLSRSILRPIQLLIQATRAVGEGQLDQPVPVRTPDELGELATAFNNMAAQLKVYRQSTSEQILRLHRTMESAIASFPDPIFVLNREGHIELMNPAARELSSQLALADTLPEGLKETAAEVLRTRRDFQPHSFKEAISFRVDDLEKSFLPRILTMRGGQNDPVGVAVVLQDVTRFRLLDAAKTNLVATVSHELKTPLTSVRMALHLLLEKSAGPLGAKQEELIQMASKEAERLLRILNDLLDLTRLEAGHSGLNLENIAPGTLVQNLVEEMQQSVLDHDLTLRSSVEPQLPPVLVDRQRLGLVFHNLIANAIKHSPPGGTIQFQAVRNTSGGIKFSVVDQGPGVPEEYQSRVFDRFFRVPHQTKKSGAGLGLSIAREITVAHGGRIGVRSEPGKGSEFYVVLSRTTDKAKVQVPV